MKAEDSDLAAILEDSDKESTLGSFFLTRDGQMLTDRSLSQCPSSPLLRPCHRNSRVEESSYLHPSVEVLRKVRLWGNQKGFKLDSKRETKLFAATLSKINAERDQFLSKSPPKPHPSEPNAPPAVSYVLAAQQLRVVKHMHEVDFSNVDIVFQQPPQPTGRNNRRRSTMQEGLHFISVPERRPKALYEPPPAFDNIRKFLQGSLPTQIFRAKSEMKIAVKEGLTEPNSPLKVGGKLPVLRKSIKLSVTTTKSSSPLERRGTHSPLLPSPLRPSITSHPSFKVKQVPSDRSNP